jgi:hypothetical protein
VLEETHAGLREHDASRTSLEELDSDLVFQLAQLAAE